LGGNLPRFAAEQAAEQETTADLRLKSAGVSCSAAGGTGDNG